MSGHSKWANIKHRKAAQDAKKGASFQKLVKAVIAAAKAGGGDPNANFRLKVAIDRAKVGNVPNDNLERAIKKGTGEIDGAVYEEIVYEGYGPNGIAVMVEALTDNRNRTAADIRSLFVKSGGAIGESGCVAWNFERKGYVEVSGKNIDEDALLTVALEAGADDMEPSEEGFLVYCEPSAVSVVGRALKDGGYAVEKAEVEMRPKNTVAVHRKDEAVKLLNMIDRFEDYEDVENVYANFEFSDEVLKELE
jgi:YebC/PmpR family DNA-binding regulatory protein